MAEALLRSGQASPALLASALMTTLDREINMFARFIRDDSGQDLIEYGLLIGIITLACIGSIKLIGPKVAKYYSDLLAIL